MRASVAVWLLPVLLGVPTLAEAAWQTAQFHDGSKIISFQYEPTLRVVKVANDEKLVADDALSQLFAAQNWQVVGAGDSKVSGGQAASSLGYPILFSSEWGDAPAVLTAELVIESTHPLQVPGCAEHLVKNLPILKHTAVWTFAAPDEALHCLKDISGQDGLVSVSPNYHQAIEARVKVDPMVPMQWHLKNTGQSGGTVGADARVLDAWDVEMGATHPLVAILDLGFEQEHPDLAPQWYVNKKEIAGNKKDDDGNGLIDDVSGWNFSINGNNLIYGQAPQHGTATSGILAAAADGKGVMGVCPGCVMLPIVMDGRPAQDAMAIAYAEAQGAVVLTNSWGYRIGTPQTKIVSDALTKVAVEGRGGKGIPILFAMNNAAVNACRGDTPDISGHPHVIAVSAVDHNDVKVPESGFGPCLQFVGPSAPYPAGNKGLVTTDRMGVKGYNTGADATNVLDQNYTNTFSGTSAATPVVAGIFGLLASQSPEQTAVQWLQRMQKAATKVQPSSAEYDANGHSLLYGYGRVDALRALQMRNGL